MSDANQYKCDSTQRTISIEKLQDDVEKLRDNLRRLEIQMAALSAVEGKRSVRTVELVEPPHTAIGKSLRCRSCKHMRLPHKSNAHYTCYVQHATIEPAWTCGAYCSK